ncbi:MAG: hypothetical protein DRP65_01985 [Planctomycetota bacterium]|nr:MAG: hypothetical protein DRP65_01985 [Planctomycetota bacterium]
MLNRDTTQRTGINIASQWGLNAVNIVVNFFLIGYVVTRVGTEHYGGWTAIVSIIGCLSMLDAGMSVAIQHYAAGFSASSQKSELISLFSSAHIIYIIIAVSVMLLCLVISFIYPTIFPKVPINAALECVVALRWISAAMLFFIMNMPVSGVLLGLQCHYIRNTIEIFSLLIRAGVVVASFQTFGPSLAYLGAAFFAAAIVRFVLNKVAIMKIEPHIRFSFSSVTRTSLRNIFSYGGHTFIWTIATVVIRDSGPILANIILDATSATYLFVGARLVQTFGAFITGAGQVFVPLASSLQASKEKARLQSALLRGTRLCSLLGLSGAMVLIIFGRAILFHWVEFDDITGYLVVVIMTIGRLSTWMFVVPLSMLKGMRALWSITIMLVTCTISCLILMLLLSHYFGLLGLATATLLPIFLAYSFWVPAKICHLTEVKVGRLLKEAIPTAVSIAILVAATAWGIQKVCVPAQLPTLVIELAIVLTLFLILAMFFGLDPASRAVLLSKAGLKHTRST